MKRLLSGLAALCLVPIDLFAWTNGELLIWMDPERGQAIQPLARKFENDLGVKVTIETPPNITFNFPLAAQAGKGPDIVIWAHDKVGEWAEGGLIAPVEVSNEYVHKFFPKAWQAVAHNTFRWGYPLALETVTLIYNKKLMVGQPPTQLSQLVSIDQQIKKTRPGIITILWDDQSAYYSWGMLASAGAYVFGKKGTNYDPGNVGVATPGAVQGLSQILALIHAGVLLPDVSYSAVEAMMAQGKVAMIISGPWAWSNLIRTGIAFGLAPIPGVNGDPAHPFVGVSLAYINRSSPNLNLTRYFLENYLVTEEGLTAMDRAKPIGVPALISVYVKLAKDNPLVPQLNAAIQQGELMPNIPQMGRVFSALGGALQIAIQGRASPQTALQEAAANIRQR